MPGLIPQARVAQSTTKCSLEPRALREDWVGTWKLYFVRTSQVTQAGPRGKKWPSRCHGYQLAINQCLHIYYIDAGQMVVVSVLLLVLHLCRGIHGWYEFESNTICECERMILAIGTNDGPHKHVGSQQVLGWSIAYNSSLKSSCEI